MPLDDEKTGRSPRKEQPKRGSEDAPDKLAQARQEAREMRARRRQGADTEEDAYLDTYTVKKGDTLSAIALRYYDSPARDKWMAIYEANKEVIGDNPGMIYPGQEFKIPRLEDED